MAYIDQDRSREKTFSGAISITLVGAVGYALVTGLAVNVFREPPGFIPGTAYRAPPPPPPPTVPRIRSTAPTAHAIPTPPTGPVQPPIDTSRIDLGTGPTIIDLGGGAGTDLAPHPVPPVDRSSGVVPRGDPGGWVTPDYYPATAIRAGQEGRTGFRLDIGIDGRPTACTIVSSSGSADLDATTCRVLMRKARFTPARGKDGDMVASTYSGGVSWKLPVE